MLNCFPEKQYHIDMLTKEMERGQEKQRGRIRKGGRERELGGEREGEKEGGKEI